MPTVRTNTIFHRSVDECCDGEACSYQWCSVHAPRWLVLDAGKTMLEVFDKKKTWSKELVPVLKHSVGWRWLGWIRFAAVVAYPTIEHLAGPMILRYAHALVKSREQMIKRPCGIFWNRIPLLLPMLIIIFWVWWQVSLMSTDVLTTHSSIVVALSVWKMLYLFLNLLTPIQHVGQQCQPFIIHHSDKKIRENKNNMNNK